MADIEPGAHGGARSNTGGTRTDAGRPKKGAEPTPLQAANLAFALERAAHEKIKREQREHDLKVEMREYIPREAVRAASARLLLTLRNTLLGVPDTLERKGLGVEWVEMVDQVIGDALDSGSDQLRQIYEANRAKLPPELRVD